MSKLIFVDPEDNSEVSRHMQRAFEVAFSECWYCEDEKAATTKFGKLICTTCNEREIRTTAPIHRMTDEQKANVLRMAIELFPAH